MDQLPNIQTARLFVERLYNLIYPYQGFNQAQLSHRQAIQEIEKQLNQLCGREMTAVMVTILTALEMNPQPTETSSMLCQRLRQRLSAVDVTLRFQQGSSSPSLGMIQEDPIELGKSPGPKKTHRVHSPIKSEKDPVIESLMNQKKDKVTLRQASEKGQLEVVKYLVEIGVDIDNDALVRASQNGHLAVVKYLVEQGADIHADDDVALLWASEEGHLDVVKYLVDQGADIHADNNRALRGAVFTGHLDIVKYLVEYLVEKEGRVDNIGNLIQISINRGHSNVTDYLRSY